MKSVCRKDHWPTSIALQDASPRNVDELIKTVPTWTNANHINYEPINDGYSNKIYKVWVDHEAFVLRINGSQNTFLGLEYKDEAQVMQLAADQNIAPGVLPVDRDEYLITHFLEGNTLKVEQMHDSDSIGNVIKVLKKVHALPYTGTRTSTPFSLTRGYLAGAKKLGLEYPSDLSDYLDQMESIEDKRRSDPAYLRHYCHNDMFNHNIFHCRDGSYILIDWELSGLGDIWFDLATISFSSGLDAAADEFLLRCYFGEADPDKIATLHEMKFVCMVREIGWALLHTAINRNAPEPGKDYMDFANSVLDRLKNGIVTLV